MSDALHRWDERADMFAHSVIGYAIERMHLRKDTTWGAVPAHRLTEALDGVICPDGIGRSAVRATLASMSRSTISL